MKKLIANREIDVNEQGYLVDFKQWDREICECIAGECNVVMTEKHWEVVEYLQDKHLLAIHHYPKLPQRKQTVLVLNLLELTLLLLHI